MSNLPKDFDNALYNLRMNEPFRQIVEAAVIADRQINYSTSAEAREIIIEMAKAIMTQMPAIIYRAGGDMVTFGDSNLAFQQAVSESFEDVSLTQYLAQRRPAFRQYDATYQEAAE